MVNYADDFVIVSRGKAAEALEWTSGVVERLELTLNEKKTSIRNACEERFDFLGYTFGPHYSERGREYIGYSPSKKSVARIKEKVGQVLVPGKRRAMGRGERAAESDFGRLASILQLRGNGQGIPGGRRVCVGEGTAFSEKAPQGVVARHSPVLRGTGVWPPGRNTAQGQGGRAFVSLR